jgi:hypothetical protein
VKRQSLSCFLLAGGTVWGRILRLLWRPGRGPHSSPPDGFGEVDSPGGTTGLAIADRRCDTREEA